MSARFDSREASLQQTRLSDCFIEVQEASSDISPISSHSVHVLALLGLQRLRPFHRDYVFLLLFALGPMVWLAMLEVSTFQPLPWQALWSPAFLSVALWQPLLEELLFRGAIQGLLLQARWGQQTWLGLSMANLAVSLLFVLGHLVSHSIAWSLLIFAPSLCFGFVRDRFGSVYPAIALHIFYNAGYFLLVGGATLLDSH